MIDFRVKTKSNIRTIDHDLINKILGCNKNVPHEWFFINYLYKHEILKNKELAIEFVMFVSQYYPLYKWYCFDSKDYVASVICEAGLYDFQFQKYYEYELEKEKDLLDRSMAFGEIVTDFLIRYCNYSLIKCSGKKVIITAQSDCDKRFEEYLLNGYSVQLKAKVGYIKAEEKIKNLFPKIDGVFYQLPVFPVRADWYPCDSPNTELFPIHEIIETKNGDYDTIMRLNKK